MGSRLDEPLTMTRSSTTYYYLTDGLGSVRQLANSSGTIVESYDYDPYGGTTIYDSSLTDITSSGSGIDNPYMFTGRRFDEETGIYHYRRRYYDPSIGRFLQRDPLGYYDSMNLYEYVGSNPINRFDPFGLFMGPQPVVPAGDGSGRGWDGSNNVPPGMCPANDGYDDTSWEDASDAIDDYLEDLNDAIWGEYMEQASEAWLEEFPKAIEIAAAIAVATSGNPFGKGGWLNNNPWIRVGMGWKGPRVGGHPVFRIAIGSKKGPVHIHIDIWPFR
ncbi:MAG: RHS repeat-associated core domain-containing protein [Candidatus Omnitrophica bacterium]|nr:RHS repeat-associated core domain-containing protein [Candidatus Omnitrophota bacterium]